MAYRPIGDILVAGGCVNRDAIEAALRKQNEGGGLSRVGKILVDNGDIQPEELVQALSEQYGLPVCPHKKPAEHLFLEEQLPFPFMIEHRVLFLTLEDSICAITDDPSDWSSIEAARLQHGEALPVYLASEEQMDAALAKVQAFAENNLKSMMAEAEVFQAGEWGDEEEHLRDLALEAPVVRMVNLIITQAVEKRASDIHVEIGDYNLRVRYRVDGVLHAAESIDKKHHAAVISRLKLLAKIDIAERRIPQDGRIKMQIHGHDLDMRVATTPTIYGENVVIRLLNQQHVELNFSSLGMPDRERDLFNKMVEQPQGFILVTGPTGSGKTTTLHTALTHLNSDKVKIITIEDPVEIRLQGINQIQMNPKIGMTFSNGLRSIVRQDPDIIMVGEIRDAETADIAIQASLTGHMVLSTLHTNDAAGSIARLADMGVESYLIASALTGSLAQRLCRRICPHCAEATVVSRSHLSDFPEAVDPEYTLYHGKGCEHCDGTGFFGRMGLYELMAANDEMRELIQKSPEAGPIRELAKKHGTRLLRESGWEAVIKGASTVEEIRRVTQWT
ncbi:GspE/PulE family protein [Pontiella sulfatireligans]|uniref:Type II secretion system protein E n=1 Tax=Pontiella sulfatireligans TaxID=2750658 RepID=A0A6C2UPH5_9BACT|nr:GspE/PulE family protein [Pontiella sulfatireligans]VGO22175.1 Type II secretion system protein E [Pontiella sulfatireligans]